MAAHLRATAGRFLRDAGLDAAGEMRDAELDAGLEFLRDAGLDAAGEMLGSGRADTFDGAAVAGAAATPTGGGIGATTTGQSLRVEGDLDVDLGASAGSSSSSSSTASGTMNPGTAAARDSLERALETSRVLRARHSSVQPNGRQYGVPYSSSSSSSASANPS